MDKASLNNGGSRYLSGLGAWALAFGCSVGWGAFVMPGTTFLPIAGPLGTTLGILIGALVMLIIGVNYSYMMNRYPDAGGTFAFTKTVFGYDHGFLSAWFMGLVYLAIIWANATAIPLISRYIFGDLLRFGYFYTIAGYEVYFGEIMVSLYNQSGSEQTVEAGERIAQLVVTPFLSVDFGEVSSLSDTARGEGGFGSTGRK